VRIRTEATGITVWIRTGSLRNFVCKFYISVPTFRCLVEKVEISMSQSDIYCHNIEHVMRYLALKHLTCDL
jgi:hypothetical protein